MKTIWTKDGNAINIKRPSEASMSTMIQYEYLTKEDRHTEAALLLVESLLQFKEDAEIVKAMSADEFGEFVTDWTRTDE